MLFLQVIFDGEEAVDAGGVTKEFFLLLLKELLNPIYGMFTYYPESNLLWFSDTVSPRPLYVQVVVIGFIWMAEKLVTNYGKEMISLSLSSHETMWAVSSVSVNLFRYIDLRRMVMIVPVKDLAHSLYSYPMIKLVLSIRWQLTEFLL